jgi:hypothetical protein
MKAKARGKLDSTCSGQSHLTRLGIDRKRVRLRIAEVDDAGGFFVGVDKLTQKAE